MDGFVDQKTLAKTKKVLRDAVYRQHMVEHNFEAAKRFYSYKALKHKLRGIMAEISHCTRNSDINGNL